MTGQKVKPTIDKIISDEVKKDFGMTPTFPIQETKVADELVETPDSVTNPGAETVGKNRDGDSSDGKTPA
jgi:predicted Fe-Mo cluster-binding NifX family protein